MIINESKLKCIELAIQAKAASPAGTKTVLDLAKDFHDYCFGDYYDQSVSMSLTRIEAALGKLSEQSTQELEFSLLNNQNQEKMAQELDDLKAAVQHDTEVDQSAITLLNGLKQKLDDAIASGDPSQLTALSQQIGASTQALADAVTANTPADTGGGTGGTGTGDTGGDTGGGTTGDTGAGGGTTEPQRG